MTFYPYIDDKGHRLRADAAEAFERLESAANLNGYGLHVNTALRTNEDQRARYKKWVKEGSDPSKPVAQPGSSEHELGIAVDLDTLKEEDFRIWLAKNSAAYGWYLTAGNEPWHIAFYPLGPPKHLLDRHHANVKSMLG